MASNDECKTKDTVIIVSCLMIISLIGLLIWSGYGREALQEQNDELFVKIVELEKELRLTKEAANLWYQQNNVYQRTTDTLDEQLVTCKRKLHESKLCESNLALRNKEIDKCLAEYEFMRASLLNEYDVDVDTFPKLINGLYNDGVIHAQVNDNIEQGLNTLCHEHLHYLVRNDKEHFVN